MLTGPDYIEQNGVKFWGTWAGRPLHQMEKDELCQIIATLNRRLLEQSERHAHQLDVLAGSPRPKGRGLMERIFGPGLARRTKEEERRLANLLTKRATEIYMRGLLHRQHASTLPADYPERAALEARAKRCEDTYAELYEVAKAFGADETLFRPAAAGDAGGSGD